MSYVLRASKFRHVFGEAKKVDDCYHSINANPPAAENFGLKGNSTYFGVSWKGGGGSLAVIPLSQTGRSKTGAAPPLINGHSGTVLDFDFNPFDEHQVATGSDDTTVKIWQIPEGGLEENMSEPIMSLDAHQKKVAFVEYHKVAENILTSASYDHTVRIWDLTKGAAATTFSDFEEIVWSVSYNRQGSQFVCSCKDKLTRIMDPRTGAKVSEWGAHQGAKPQRAVWAGRKDKIITVGFSRQSSRQVTLWDPRNLDAPVHNIDIDIASGVFIPMYDDDTNVLFLAGKGDLSIKYFEVADESPYLFSLSEYAGSKPQKGACMLSKKAGDVMQCEIARILRLTDNMVEPVAMRVPRKSPDFQDDIFPDTDAPIPALSAEEWLGGKNADPKTMSMRPGEELGAAPKKAKKTYFELQKEVDEKDARIQALEAQVAELEKKLAGA